MGGSSTYRLFLCCFTSKLQRTATEKPKSHMWPQNHRLQTPAVHQTLPLPPSFYILAHEYRWYLDHSLRTTDLEIWNNFPVVPNGSNISAGLFLGLALSACLTDSLTYLPYYILTYLLYLQIIVSVLIKGNKPLNSSGANVDV